MQKQLYRNGVRNQYSFVWVCGSIEMTERTGGGGFVAPSCNAAQHCRRKLFSHDNRVVTALFNHALPEIWDKMASRVRIKYKHGDEIVYRNETIREIKT